MQGIDEEVKMFITTIMASSSVSESHKSIILAIAGTMTLREGINILIYFLIRLLYRKKKVEKRGTYALKYNT